MTTLQQRDESRDDAALAGATRVLMVWAVAAALIGALYRQRITATVEWWFLLCIFLSMSGLLAPVYGGFVYFSARRRMQRRKARAAAITTAVIFLLSLVAAALVIWMLKALGHLR